MEAIITENLESGCSLMLYLEGRGTGHACVIDGLRYREEELEVHITLAGALKMMAGFYCGSQLILVWLI